MFSLLIIPEPFLTDCNWQSEKGVLPDRSQVWDHISLICWNKHKPLQFFLANIVLHILCVTYSSSTCVGFSIPCSLLNTVVYKE